MPSTPHDAVMEDIERRRLTNALRDAAGNQSTRREGARHAAHDVHQQAPPLRPTLERAGILGGGQPAPERGTELPAPIAHHAAWSSAGRSGGTASARAPSQNGWFIANSHIAGVLRLTRRRIERRLDVTAVVAALDDEVAIGDEPGLDVARRDGEVHADAEAAEDVLVAVHRRRTIAAPQHDARQLVRAGADPRLDDRVVDAARQRDERRERRSRAPARADR